MTKKACTIIIKPEDHDQYEIAEIDFPSASTSETIHAVVGGYFELFPTSSQITVFINENGKSEGLPRNYMAEQFLIKSGFDIHGCLAAGDWIAGNAVIMGPPTPSGDTKSCLENTIDLIRAMCDE